MKIRLYRLVKVVVYFAFAWFGFALLLALLGIRLPAAVYVPEVRDSGVLEAKVDRLPARPSPPESTVEERTIKWKVERDHARARWWPERALAVREHPGLVFMPLLALVASAAGYYLATRNTDGA